jgi:hypothetical protein
MFTSTFRRGPILVVFGAVVAGAMLASALVARGDSQPTTAHVRARTAEAHARLGAEPEAIEAVQMAGERLFRQTAPFQETAPGAYAAAVADAKSKPKLGNAWTPVGGPALYADHPDYAGGDPVVTAGPSRLGWSNLSGRITSFAYDPANTNRVFAGPAAGGVWESTDGGANWKSIGDGLPTQAMGAVAFAPTNGGTIIAGTGDNAVGGVITPSGLGVYTSTNDGKSWTNATGVPDGIVTFEIAVDPGDPRINYVGTSRGLFRSTDGGKTYTNVALPVPKVVGGVTTPNGCAGDTTSPACTYAAVVTDVGVQGGTGAVIAAVGWVYGRTVTKAGIMQAPQNGIYTSPTGAPGTFTFQDPGASAPTSNGFAPTPVVGRTTLAVANGPGQDHRYVYALVQDATKLQSCIDTALNLPICTGTGNEVLAQATFLDGAYVSKDFGRTWTKIMTAEQLRLPGTGSALELGILGYGPGIQSWYNNWIEVDPTAAAPLTGAPTRVAFGLEEIWENALPTPVDGPTSWKVIGRYWNACLLLVAGTQCSGASSPIPGTTTHPDQHAGLFVPDAVGGVTLYAGNDGGAYKQHVGAGQDFSNDRWGDGINLGLHTLQPYDANGAKDGTIVAGLQDNGTIKIGANGRQDMIFGGDGFFAGIDPDNSQRIVEEYTYGLVNGSTDGGKTWSSYPPSWGGSSADALFATPFQIDPTNADHLMIGGSIISQTPYPYEAHCIDGSPGTTCSPSGSPVNPGLYDNWTDVYDLGVVSGTTVPRKTTALDLEGDVAYAGFCGPCSVFTKMTGFESGIVTNAGVAEAPQFGSAAGWHEAAASGLPDRYITSVRIDPSDASGRTIYVTLGGYSSHWVPPGASDEDISRVGVGHVFVSRDAGATFANVSGNLPDAPADWVLPRAGKLIVGTDVGAFISSSADGGSYGRLGDLPAVPVVTIREDPGNAKRLIAATFGRGVYAYTFK